MSWAVKENGPCLGHYQVGADALYAEYFYLAIFGGCLHPSCLADTEEYAPVTGGITTTSFGWIGAKIATYTKLPKDALQLSRVAVSWAGPSIPGALRAAAAEPGFQQVWQLGRSGGSP